MSSEAHWRAVGGAGDNSWDSLLFGFASLCSLRLSVGSNQGCQASYLRIAMASVKGRRRWLWLQ